MAAHDYKFPDPEATVAGGNVATSSSSGATSTGSGAGTAMAAPVFPAATVLCDRYEIVHLLGEGGMGAVYKALDRETERLVALKTIRPEMANNTDMLARFKQELVLARQVTHRNVVRIYDLGEAAGTKFITMEYVEGDDLRALLKPRGKLSPAEAVDVMRQVCRALEAAHAEGVIHRDLKPQNIMRDHSGRVVVMDFGLARTLESSMTQTGALVGTLEYMSPEQALGGEIDARSDLFAIGLIFYELLTGRGPYRAESAIASLLKRSQERAVPVSEVDASVPRDLSNIVAKCLERDRAQRYQTASEILHDLELWSGGSPVSVVLPQPAAKPRPRRLGYVVAAVVLIALAGGVFALRHWFAPARALKQPAPAGPVVTLAVVPLRNASGDRSLDWLGSSIAEMLTTDVGQAAELHVVSADHMHQLLRDLRVSPDTTLDEPTLRRLAQFSSADQLLSGQYTRLGSQIRLDLVLQDLKQQRSIPLKAEAPNENELMGAIDRLAQDVRGNLSLSAAALEDLKTQSFKPSTKSLEALRYYEQGLDLTRDGKASEAVKQFEASTKADPAFALAYAKLGEAYWRLGYGDKADEFAQKAVDRSQKLPAQERYRILASRAVVTNDTRQAIKYYEDLAKVAPSDSAIQLSLAQLHQQTGDYDTAREYLRKLLAREPGNPEALVALAHVEGEAHNPQGALDYLNRALTLAVQLDNDELRARVLYENGYIYRLLKKPDEALRNYQQALAIRRRLGQKAGIAQALAESAEIFYTQGKPEPAIASYKEALQLQREIGDKTYLSHSLLNLGGLYSDRGQYDEALKYLKESLQLQRDLHDEHYEAMCLNNIGNVYLSTGRFDDALTYYQQALDLMQKLKLTGDIPAVLYNLADTSAHMGQNDQAVNYYLHGLELARGAGSKQLVALGAFSLGKLFEAQGRYGAALSSEEDAVKTYRELQDRSSSLAQVLAGYGHTLALVGRSDEARKVLDEAISLARDTKNDMYLAQALAFEGDRRFYGGDLKSAKTMYAQALPPATRSKDPETLLLVKTSLAHVAVDEGRGRQAISELKRLAQDGEAQGLRQLSVQSSLYLVEALVSAKDYRAAGDEADRLRRVTEKLGMKLANAQARYLQAEVLRFTGHASEAAPHYQQARQLLDEIGAESRSESLLKRPDLHAMMTAPQ